MQAFNAPWCQRLAPARERVCTAETASLRYVPCGFLFCLPKPSPPWSAYRQDGGRLVVRRLRLLGSPPGWRSDVAARKPRRGAPIVDWDRQAPRCFTRRVGHHNRRCRASIIAQNVAASIIKIQYRATARHRLADQIHARSATRHASRYSITDADLCRILGYEQCPRFTYERCPRSLPRFEQEHVAIMGATLDRHRHYVETRKLHQIDLLCSPTTRVYQTC